MKQLIILRHGKSSWENFDIDDFDRPLNERGRKNAAEMGNFIKAKSGAPELILTSSAVRAFQTATIVAENMDYSSERIRTEKSLYLAWTNEILKKISDIPDTISFCLLVGHNPGLTELVNHFGIRLDNLPTASAVCFEFDAAAWKDISRENAAFQWIQLARSL